MVLAAAERMRSRPGVIPAVGRPPDGGSHGGERALREFLGGWFPRLLVGALCLFGAAVLTACKSPPATAISPEDRQPFAAAGVQPGDQMRIMFPGAPTMNTAQQVQSDGTITLAMGGSLQVRGKTPPEIERAILDVYGPQLVVKEVSVSLESAGFPVFISGAVLRPGRVVCRQSVTVLEAIVDAGGFVEGRADLRQVKVVRKSDSGTTRTFVVNLHAALKGESAEPFYLRPFDVVYVPERFSFY